MLLTKEQRTVYVSQLTQKTDSHDLRKYFKRKAGPVESIYFLTDKRTGRHKGGAYVEMKRLNDVPYAVSCNGRVPSFQKFPILVRPSESERNLGERNLGLGTTVATTVGTTPSISSISSISPIAGSMAIAGVSGSSSVTVANAAAPGFRIHVGQIVSGVSADQLRAICSFIGAVQSVNINTPACGNPTTFGFVNFARANEAALAIEALAGVILAGSHIKTGWAKNGIDTGADYANKEGPVADAAIRTERARAFAATVEVFGASKAAAVPNLPGMEQQLRQNHELQQQQKAAAAQAAADAAFASVQPSHAQSDAASAGAAAAHALFNKAAAAAPVVTANLEDEESGVSLKNKGSSGQSARNALMAKLAARAGVDVEPKQEPISTKFIIHNCFDKDEETEENWATEILEDMKDECGKFGVVVKVDVKDREPGGKVVVEYQRPDMAEAAIKVFHNRWFGERQLKCESLK
jgi:RNA-binding protein 39